MEETVQQEKPESEYKVQNEDEGGIRRRLRDRDLLRKRKAEAEEKETYQWVIGVESQRKRPRAEQRSGSKKRGRPRKSEPTPEISFTQGETAQDTPAVVVVPEPVGVIPAQTSGSLIPLLAMGSDTFELPTSVLAAPAPMPVFGSVQNPLFTPTLTSPAPAPVNTTPALVSPSVFAPSPAKVLDKAPVPAQDSSPAPDAVPVPALSQALVPAVAPAPPTAQVETLYAESKGKEALDQVLIEDLGPDEEEDISSTQDKSADEDLNESPLINVPEQNKTSIPTLSSPLPPQEYLPGN